MFSRTEKRFIGAQYFEIIRETEDFIEVKSQNTKHCWIIQKHMLDVKAKYIFIINTLLMIHTIINTTKHIL